MDDLNKTSKKKDTKTLVIFSILFLLVATLFAVSFMPFIIELNGEETVEIVYGSKYEELGANDIFGKPITKVEGVVDSEELGTYTITYCFLNATKTRTVIVKDVNAPSLTLIGNQTITVIKDCEFTDPGCTAIDDIEGDISDRITVNSTVDLTTVGSYTITYDVSDSSGNKSRIRRMINVADNGPLLLSVRDFNLNGCFENTILKETNEDTTEKFKNLIFVGDSIIDNLTLFGYISGKNVWARSSLDPDNVYTRELHLPRSTPALGTFFEDGLSKYKPEYVCVLFGTNLMTSVSVEYYSQSFEKFIQKCVEVSPDTKFIICSILPEYLTRDNEAQNDKINKINYHVAAICENYGMYFMNCAEVFKDGNGYGNSRYLMEDGFHPTSGAGCRLLIDYIKRHLSY